ncbi:DUF4129 domain-containing protein [Streptomyces sp. HNM0574]|uniref:DUF4129 domain-containing protein n=1 Tax=Streptomyces sp. HNM0574 TaxID=2714954 RepID=UPI00146D08EB|nr:DUF4129 domain-containing protein [Streptomyces sp. HNM0574]NLU67405.1 DUF4129 domain-containing protein [Streptomyces sp. HNM0574]
MTGGAISTAAHAARTTAPAPHAAPPVTDGPAGARGDGPPVTVPRVPAREAAERELTDPRYHEHDPGLLQRALDWLWEHLSALLSSAADAAPGGWAGITALLAVVLLLLLALRLRLGRLRTTRPAPNSSPLDDGRPRTAEGHRTAAETHAASGHWDEAVRERMRALVRALEERALLDPRPGRTADEAAADAGTRLPAQAEALRAAARTFDEVTYGAHPAGPADYARLRELDTTLGRTRPTPADEPRGAAR